MSGCQIKFDKTSGWIENPVLSNYDNLEKNLFFDTDSALYKTEKN